MEMERRKCWSRWIIKSSFFVLTKDTLAKAALNLRHRAKEKSEGLVSLYKDMEACGGYADIQVMWEMIHTSPPPPPPNVHKNKSTKKFKYWRFCFQQA